MLHRHLLPRLRLAQTDRAVVLLNGARQVGKSTLARALAAESGARYVTLDDVTVSAAARSDPEGFISAVTSPIVLDEVQRAPELFLAIKASVDRDRRPGRFLLTGSANALLLPQLAEALVGRMELLTLWPLSQGEVTGPVEGFVDALFGAGAPDLRPVKPGGRSLVDRILRGGYPEAVTTADDGRRSAWFTAYVTTLLARDVRELARIDTLADLPRLVRLVAARPMAMLNYAELARSAGVPQTTLKRYLTLLQTVFLVRTLPPWHANLGKRLVKTPKVLFTDVGLAAHLMGLDRARLHADRTLLGGLLESFVVMEIEKQIGWSETSPAMYHFRSHAGEEVDLVLEQRSGTIAGIEVKSAATVTASDFKGLRLLADAVGPKFHRGVVLYTGREVVPFGPRLFAVPIEGLWEWGAKRGPARARARG